jgi:pyruvate dehydrogenase E1 component alpha subunit
MSVIRNKRNLAPTRDELLTMYRRMMLIRRTEERLGDAFHKGELPASVHLYIGQEASGVGICAHLSDADWIASTHRGHGHYLAKGGAVGPMVAEVFGKATGICRGMGGSMHVADFSKGIMGANGIVGAGISISAGAALAAQLEGKRQVAVCFFGDGAAAQGLLSETMNIAALWKLPLVLVCENNGFSEFSPTDTVTAGVIAERGEPFGIPGVVVDGNDIEAVWKAGMIAIERARVGEGPSLIETRTYRWRGHVEAEVAFLAEKYRSDAEIESWKALDPIARLAIRLSEGGQTEHEVLARLDAEVGVEVDAAFTEAKAAPWPEARQTFDVMNLKVPV